jgi:DNA polymerase I-like protein with 3'-5' exonuclease and polymerase domains
MAGDPEMIRIYLEDGDIHTETALIVMGVTMAMFRELSEEEQSLARFKAKAVNFGFIYGMGWRKFIVYAKTQYGVEFTEDEAKRVRSGFFRKYGALQYWHEAMREFAHSRGFVRSFSGRIRHLPMIYSEDEGVAAEAGRQAINSPVQEFGSSLGVMSLGRVEQEVDPTYMAMIGFVHDALYAWVPYEYVEWAAKTMKYYMESNPIKEWFGVDMTIPIKADVGFGLDGGHTHEMKNLKMDEKYDFSIHEFENGFVLPKQKIPPMNGRVKTPEHLIIHV